MLSNGSLPFPSPLWGTWRPLCEAWCPGFCRLVHCVSFPACSAFRSSPTSKWCFFTRIYLQAHSRPALTPLVLSDTHHLISLEPSHSLPVTEPSAWLPRPLALTGKETAVLLILYFWLCRVFIATCGLSLVVASGGSSLVAECVRLIAVASLAVEHGL